MLTPFSEKFFAGMNDTVVKRYSRKDVSSLLEAVWTLSISQILLFASS